MMTTNDPCRSHALVLCPHPDDFDVAAVTLKSFHRSKKHIYVAIAPTFSGILDEFYPAPVTDEEKITTREQEQRSSLLFFGLDEAQFEFFPHDVDLDQNGEWTYSERNAALVEQCILEQAPDTILLPHPNDQNPAHSAMYRMVKESLVRHRLSVRLLKQMDPKTGEMRVDFYTPLTDEDVVWKTELFNHHKTQDHRNLQTRGVTLADRILKSNAQIAENNHLPCRLAEAFEIEQFSDPFPVELVTVYTEELWKAFAHLVPQLADIPVPTDDHLQALVEGSSSAVLVMRDVDTEQIVATVTVGIYLIPTGRRAWIEDVILDQNYRGRGLAEKLMGAAENYAVAQGIKEINLTSSPSRVAANRLYQKLGYEMRETNSYRKSL